MAGGWPLSVDGFDVFSFCIWVERLMVVKVAKSSGEKGRRKKGATESEVLRGFLLFALVSPFSLMA